MEERIVRWILGKFLVGVVNKVEKGAMDQKKMRGLVKVN
jgi:hypothetical protein